MLIQRAFQRKLGALCANVRRGEHRAWHKYATFWLHVKVKCLPNRLTSRSIKAVHACKGVALLAETGSSQELVVAKVTEINVGDDGYRGRMSMG